MAMILVDRFGKRLFLIPCYKNINAKEAARLYIYYIYQIYRPGLLLKLIPKSLRPTLEKIRPIRLLVTATTSPD